MSKVMSLNKIIALVCFAALSFSAISFAEDLSSTSGIIKGSFIQPYLAETWTPEDWQSEFKYMLQVKMDQIILQWTSDYNHSKWYYPSILNKDTVKGYDQVQPCLASAQRLNMKVWIGLNNNDQWWIKHANDEKWLNKEFEINISMALELWKLYGNQYGDTIAGFYMTLEMDNVNFLSNEAQNRMAINYKKLCDAIHSNTNKSVMISPFFSAKRGLNAVEYSRMWGKIISVAPIDVIAVQDGVGVKHCRADGTAEWFASMKNAITKNRPETKLWANIETMERKMFHYVPADSKRLARQISEALPYVDNFICFSFNHYQSPHQKQIKGFNEYKKVLEQGGIN
jgi:hypothetical protein